MPEINRVTEHIKVLYHKSQKSTVRVVDIEVKLLVPHWIETIAFWSIRRS